MRRIGLLGMLAIAAVACVAPPENTVDRAVDGPVATSAAVSIGYPSDISPFGLEIADLEARWADLAVTPLGAPELVRVGDGEVAPGSSVALDVAVEGTGVLIAQLTVINEAGDDDEARAADLVAAFVEAITGSDLDTEGILSGLGFGDGGALFGEAAVVSVSGEYRFLRASNEDTILLGVVGSR